MNFVSLYKLQGERAESEWACFNFSFCCLEGKEARKGSFLRLLVTASVTPTTHVIGSGLRVLRAGWEALLVEVLR
jgi:hypothetical protein